MNIFLREIGAKKIKTLSDLKRRFRELAKQFHPDLSTVPRPNENFNQIKTWYEEAHGYLQAELKRKNETTGTKDTVEGILRVFSELVPGNFPIDASVRSGNKKYVERVNAINEFCNGTFVERDIFFGFEDELNRLKGTTTVSNHLFNVVKLYIYRFNDYRNFKTAINKNYLVNGYSLVMGIFIDRKMRNGILFLNWLVYDIIEPESRMGDLPTIASS